MEEIHINKSKFVYLQIFQSISLSIVIIGGIIIFMKIKLPKDVLDETGADLILEFRKINNTSHEIGELIDSINEMKVKIPIDSKGLFSISNNIKYTLKKVQHDVFDAQDFSNNMLRNPYLTNYSVPLTIILNGVFLMLFSCYSMIKKKQSIQRTLFFFSGVSLSFTIYTMGMYFANFTSIHDICNEIIN